MSGDSQRAQTRTPFGMVRATATMLVVLLAVPVIAEAADFEFNALNDISTVNERKDDFYTSDLSFAFSSDSHRITFEERTFTNREQEIRFDETYLTWSMPPLSSGGWHARPEFGALHVGKGVFGESAQNAIHRAIGESTVAIPYIEENHLYATGTINVHRQFREGTALPIRVEAIATTAPGFRSTVEVQLGISRELGAGLGVRLGAGVRMDHVSNPWLEDVVDSAGPTGALTVAWRWIELGVTKNRYGTGAIHATVGFRVNLPGRS